MPKTKDREISIKYFFESNKSGETTAEKIRNTKEYMHDYYKDKDIDHLVSRYVHLYNLTIIYKQSNREIFLIIGTLMIAMVFERIEKYLLFEDIIISIIFITIFVILLGVLIKYIIGMIMTYTRYSEYDLFILTYELEHILNILREHEIEPKL